MSGTSLDGLDAALVSIDGVGEGMTATILAHGSRPFDAIETIERLARGGSATAAAITEAARTVGTLHAELLEAVVREAGLDPRRDLDLVAVHGQTVMHRPPLSWQLVDPWPLVRSVECPIVCDLRSADLVAGGQGAPITPQADAILFRELREEGSTLAVINLGGFVNVTLLPDADGDPIGFDCCPCNHLLDEASRDLLDAPFDRDGVETASGRADEAASDRLGGMIGGLAGDARSGGDGDEHREDGWRLVAEAIGRDRPADILATIASAIASVTMETIEARRSDADSPRVGRVVLAGGGARNRGLVEALQDRCNAAIPPASIATSDESGIGPEAREAAAMAVLGTLCLDGTDVGGAATTGRTGPTAPAGLWIRGGTRAAPRLGDAAAPP